MLSKRNALIAGFLNSPIDKMLVDWKALGYLNARSCRHSLYLIIKEKKYPCFVDRKKDLVCLVKAGYLGDIWDNVDTPICGMPIAFDNSYVKSSLDNFNKSDLFVYRIPWEKLGYPSSLSVYHSYKTLLRRYNYRDKILVGIDRDEVYLVKKVEYPTFETKLEPCWAEGKLLMDESQISQIIL